MKAGKNRYLKFKSACQPSTLKGYRQVGFFLFTNILKYALICSILIWSGCEEQPPPSLTNSQRELIDTLYLREISVIRPQLDSTCDANFAANVQLAVDSLIKVRREEEARLRERILQQQ
jgi:hypothetical protein